jgi:hypothetical protein
MTLQVNDETNYSAVQSFCKENENLLMYNEDLAELYEIFIDDYQNISFEEFKFFMLNKYLK